MLHNSKKRVNFATQNNSHEATHATYPQCYFAVNTGMYNHAMCQRERNAKASHHAKQKHNKLNKWPSQRVLWRPQLFYYINYVRQTDCRHRDGQQVRP